MQNGDQLFAMTDPIAERVHKLGGESLRSVGDIARHQRLQDSDEPSLSPEAMLSELLSDNRELTAYLRATQEICDRHNDLATASLIENGSMKPNVAPGSSTKLCGVDPPKHRKDFSCNLTAARKPTDRMFRRTPLHRREFTKAPAKLETVLHLPIPSHLIFH